MDISNKEVIIKSELYERIITTAIKAFIKEGIKPVKMDDIANKLSISKRTLYETFNNKEDLLFECVKRQQEENKSYFSTVLQRTDNILEIILEFYFRKQDYLRRVNYRFFEDIKKYPRIMEFMRTEREESRKSAITFLKKGIEQGLFKDDINMDIVNLFANSLNDLIMKEDLGKIYPLDELFKTQIILFIRGICTKNGEQIFDKTFTEYENRIE